MKIEFLEAGTPANVTITKFDDSTRAVEGTFVFKCNSKANSGDDLFYRVRAGTFKVKPTNTMVVTTTPKDTLSIAE